MFLEVSRAAVMLLTVWLNLIQIIYWLKSEFNLAPRCAPTKELLWQRLNRLFLGFVEKFYVYIIGSCLSFAFPTINNSDNLLLDCTVIFNLQLRCWTSTHTATNYNINHSLIDVSVLYHINCEQWWRRFELWQSRRYPSSLERLPEACKCWKVLCLYSTAVYWEVSKWGIFIALGLESRENTSFFYHITHFLMVTR